MWPLQELKIQTPYALKFAIMQREGELLKSIANVIYNEVLLHEDE